MNKEKLLKIIENFNEKKILVLGDIIKASIKTQH
jgi:hypothetical protein